MFYLYVQPSGLPDVSDQPLDLDQFPGYKLIGSYRSPPDVYGKRYENGQWVDANPTPEYVRRRRANYPSVGDQLDALWHAMDKGVLPRVDSFYQGIKKVKEQFPRSGE